MELSSQCWSKFSNPTRLPQLADCIHETDAQSTVADNFFVGSVHNVAEHVECLYVGTLVERERQSHF
jgi:hypothetical protein